MALYGVSAVRLLSWQCRDFYTIYSIMQCVQSRDESKRNKEIKKKYTLMKEAWVEGG